MFGNQNCRKPRPRQAGPTDHADGITYLANYFAQPFPFPKYGMVMIPGFAYGGMEHAGATVFARRVDPVSHGAHAQRPLNRDILLLHELNAQWFGDLVTMRWFDDLWLKEGFAQYMAYHALELAQAERERMEALLSGDQTRGLRH